MPATRLLIASGSDSAYFPLLRDTVLSVLAQRQNAAIGILDFGLTPDQRKWLADRVTHLVRPGWDVDFPDRERTPETRKAQLSRPFLRCHFPGYESYLWIDADAWLQDWRVIELYLAAAGRD
ncbi:MAG: macrocin O-methyltransferase, partial [Alphaproteobacteria bacterium]|nr:macrocin O-methyltransferase [Alphaproteobacteria bacterium]